MSGLTVLVINDCIEKQLGLCCFFCICGFFQLLIKSMSKMNNHIVIKQDIKLEYPQGVLSTADDKKVIMIEQKNPQSNGPQNISSSLVHHESYDILSANKQDDEDFRFSRFQPWHLTHMVENNKVDRQTEENRVSAEKNLQQLNLESQEQEFYFFTPVKPETYGFVEKKTGVLPSSKKKSALIQTIAERKIRPKQKGLRKLSGKAFQIVKQLRQATYKQVALRLIKEIQDDESDIDDEREQNNIKRRVYDALNVLIAMGILQKRGRNIVYELNSKIAQEQNNNLIFKQNKEKLLMQLKLKAEDLTKKKLLLKQLETKIQIYNQLITRNLNSNSHPEERIQVPFVCLQVPSDSVKTIKLYNNKGQFTITTENSYQFFGDLDFLLKHHTPRLS